ncbi:26326_t:CDS:2, partial [Racocetra persica]
MDPNQKHLIEVILVEWKTYLDARKTYKEKILRNNYNGSLENILKEFNSLVNRLSDSDLKQFILFTSKQDIVVFCDFMIEEITTLPENELGTFKGFIIERHSKYLGSLVDMCHNLPENVKKYINTERSLYKKNLYHDSQFDVSNFKEINETYSSLISTLDDD